MRMDKQTPVRKALEEALRPAKKSRGKPATTWMKVIEKDLNPIIQINLNTHTPEQIIQTLESVTKDRKQWAHPWPTINIRPHIMHFRRLAFSYTEVIY